MQPAVRAWGAAAPSSAAALMRLLRGGAVGAAAAFTTTRAPAAPIINVPAAAAAREAAARRAPPPALHTIGFVGVGNMGSPMAAALMRAGHKLVVCDRNPAAVAQLQQAGASAAGSAREVAETPGDDGPPPITACVLGRPTATRGRGARGGRAGLLLVPHLARTAIYGCCLAAPLPANTFSPP